MGERPSCPAWLPRGVAEALLLAFGAVVLRVALDSWLPQGRMSWPPDDALAPARALLAAAPGWLGLALAFGLAARVSLALAPGAAIGAGAFAFTALLAGPLLARLAPQPAPEAVVLQAAAASLFALALGAALTRGVGRALAFSLAAGLLAAGGLTLLETPPQSLSSSMHLPLPAAVAALWLALGGAGPRAFMRAVVREAPRSVFGFVALAILAGWLAAGAPAAPRGSWPGALFPLPSALGLVGALLSLWLACAAGAGLQGRLRRRAAMLRRRDLAAMAGSAALLALAVSVDLALAAAAFGAVLLVLVWPLGAARPSPALALPAGAALALAAFAAGAALWPGLAPERFVSGPQAALPAAAAVAGLALAGLYRAVEEATGERPPTTARLRLAAALWCLDFAAAVAVAAAVMGAKAPLWWAVFGFGAAGLAALLAFDRRLAHAGRLPGLLLAWSAICLALAVISPPVEVAAGLVGPG